MTRRRSSGAMTENEVRGMSKKELAMWMIVMLGALLFISYQHGYKAGSRPERCEQTKLYLCGEARRAADLLRESNQARQILEEAMGNARCDQ